MSFAAHYGRPTLAPYARERSLASTAGVVKLFELAQPAGDFSDPPLAELVVSVSRTSHRGEWAVGGVRGGRTVRGQYNVVNPGTPTRIIMREDNAFSVAVIPPELARGCVEEMTEGKSGVFDGDALNARASCDPFIDGMLRQMWQRADPHQPSASSLLYGDGAVMTLIAALSAGLAPPRPIKVGGLSPRQAKRATDYLLAHLSEDVSLERVAAEVGLSPWYFCRAFKDALGLAPFRWMQAQRVERARTLLANPKLSVLEVAAAVGYANQGHFARIFRRETGVSPREFRRAL